MCERCGYSGCQHDWKRWTPIAYSKGYADGDAGRRLKSPYAKCTQNASGYVAGWHAGNYWYEQRCDDEECIDPVGSYYTMPYDPIEDGPGPE